jgi:hypothetical protein
MEKASEEVQSPPGAVEPVIMMMMMRRRREEEDDKGSLFNPLNVELNSICHLLALVGAHRILHISGLRVNITNNIT